MRWWSLGFNNSGWKILSIFERKIQHKFYDPKRNNKNNIYEWETYAKINVQLSVNNNKSLKRSKTN